MAPEREQAAGATNRNEGNETGTGSDQEPRMNDAMATLDELVTKRVISATLHENADRERETSSVLQATNAANESISNEFSSNASEAGSQEISDKGGIDAVDVINAPPGQDPPFPTPPVSSPEGRIGQKEATTGASNKSKPSRKRTALPTPGSPQPKRAAARLKRSRSHRAQPAADGSTATPEEHGPGSERNGPRRTASRPSQGGVNRKPVPESELEFLQMGYCHNKTELGIAFYATSPREPSIPLPNGRKPLPAAPREVQPVDKTPYPRIGSSNATGSYLDLGMGSISRP